MADNLLVKDANGTDRTLAAKDVSTVHVPRHILVDETNAAISPATQATLAAILAALKAEDAAHVSGDLGLPALVIRKDTAVALGADGDYTLLQTDANGKLHVVQAGHPAALGQTTMSASLPVALASDQSSIPVAGTAAHNAAISGNPVRIGGRAATSSFSPVTSGTAVDFMATQLGVQIVRPFSIPQNEWSYAAASGGILNTTTAVTVKGNLAANLNYLTWLDISSEALGTATEVAIRDGAGGTVLWRMKIGTAGIPNGRSIQFPSPLKSSSNTLLEVVTLTASGTGAVYVNCGGYTAP